MRLNVKAAGLPEALLLTPALHRDDRGWFIESWNERDFCEVTGLNVRFVQDNHSCSARNVLRGLHYQIPDAQGKLVRVTSGMIFDVIVDLRRSSPGFGRWVSHELSADNRLMLWIPPGFAHGFLSHEGDAQVMYKTTNYWNPKAERSLLWDDPDLNIPWPISGASMLSAKDRAGKRLRDAEVYS